MSETTPATAPAAVDPSSVCVLCDAKNFGPNGEPLILGGQSFSTYSPNGATKAATKLENVHKEKNVTLRSLLAKLASGTVTRETLTNDEKVFLTEYGEKEKPESLEIRIIDTMSFKTNIVQRNLPKPVVVLTAAQKAEKLAKAKAAYEALLSSATVG